MVTDGPNHESGWDDVISVGIVNRYVGDMGRIKHSNLWTKREV